MADDSTTTETTDVTTEPSTTTETLDASNAEEVPDGAEQGDVEDQDHDGGNREAAKYRRRLRDAEGERDTLRTRLETLQRTEAERLAAQHLAKGTALWAGGATLDDLLDDDGNLDAEKVTTRAQEVREQFGIAKPRTGLHVPGEGNNPTVYPKGNSMVDVVMGKQP